MAMTLLLVDERDGRIVAELETDEEVGAVLDSWAHDDAGFAEHLCLVQVTARDGSFLGTNSIVSVRPLS